MKTNKRNIVAQFVVSVVLFVLLIITPLVLYAATFIDDARSEFDLGTYVNTEWDTNRVELQTSQTSGTYISQVLVGSDSGLVTWDSINWVPDRPIYKELPNGGVVESAYSSGNINMKGNPLLMHFNEQIGSTTFLDLSGNNYNGTCSGSACPVAGAVGKLSTSLVFDGLDDEVNLDYETVGDALNTSAQITIAAWVYPETWSGGPDTNDNSVINVLMDGTNSGVWLSVDPTNSYKLRIGGRSRTLDSFQEAISTVSVSQNQWSFVTGVIDIASDTITTYVNGLPVGSSSVSFGSASYTANGSPSRQDLIGGGGDHPFLGRIDEVAIWGKELSSTQILDLYKRGALQLKYQVRSCDDTACAGEVFYGPDGTATTYYSELNNLGISLPSFALTNVNDNLYFQYKAFFDTDNANYTPQLKSMSVNYTATDPYAPATITNLELSNPTTTTIQLAWVAPGDDGTSIGTASSYDIRYLENPITELNWDVANLATNEPSPSVAGSAELFVLTGLTANTTYYVAMKVSDEIPNTSGLSNVPSITTPDTDPPPDMDSPVISSVVVTDITQTDAIVTWQTDETSTSQVEYGLTAGYGMQSVLDTNLVTSHSVMLSNLSAGTIYHFRVISIDSSDNQGVSSDDDFITDASVVNPTPTPQNPSQPTVTPTPISDNTTTPDAGLTVSDSVISNVGTDRFTVSWVTNLNATSEVLFGTQSGNYLSQKSNSNMYGLNHEVVIDGLIAETTYFFVVKSVAGNSEVVTSGERRVTTIELSAMVVGTPGTTNAVVAPGETVTSISILPTVGDIDPPVITVQPVTENPTASEIVVIRGTATDVIGVIAGLAISLDGGESWHPVSVVDGLGTGSVRFEYTTPKLEDGTYQVTVRARDNSDNEGHSVWYQLVIDRLAPIFGGRVMLSGTQPALISNSGVQVAVVGVAQRMVVSIKGGPSQVRADFILNDVGKTQAFRYVRSLDLWMMDITFEVPGIYESRLIAIDDAGHETVESFAPVEVESYGQIIGAHENNVLQDARVLLRHYVDDTSSWGEWPADAYGQQNPQVTDSDGAYQFLVPSGKYYLEVTRGGYRESVSQIVVVDGWSLIRGDILLQPQPKFTFGPIYTEITFPNQVWLANLTNVDQSELGGTDVSEFFGGLIGLRTPDAELKTVDGFVVDLGLQLGRPTLVTFWNTWDTRSQEQVSILNELIDEVGSSKLILPVVLQEDASVVQNYLRRGGYVSTSLIDDIGYFANAFGLYGLPQHIFIDKDGVLDSVHSGLLSVDDLQEILSEL